MDTRHPDAELIDRLGGPADVARLLGFNPKGGGVQRVQNWKTRGIPEVIRLRRPDLFGEGAQASDQGSDDEAGANAQTEVNRAA